MDRLKLFGKRLQELRKERGILQREMAGLLEITDVHYGRIERGTVNVPSLTLCTLADYFGVSTDYLLGRTDRREPCG